MEFYHVEKVQTSYFPSNFGDFENLNCHDGCFFMREKKNNTFFDKIF